MAVAMVPRPAAESDRLVTFRRKNEALSLFDPVAAAMGPCKIVHFPAPKHF